MLIFVRIETHAVIFSGISVRIVDLASEAFWSHFVRIGTRHFGQNLAKSVRIGTRDPLGMGLVPTYGTMSAIVLCRLRLKA